MVKLKRSFDYILHLGAGEKIFSRAKSLRHEMTEAEKVLWEALRNKKLNNAKFRRQHPIKQFIADFYCHEAKLVIEVDGGIHNLNTVSERDEGRTQELNRMGIKVIRFSNEEITTALDRVLEEIRLEITSPPSATPQREGRCSAVKWGG
jgi:very-short-patch-repair endonuclease